MDNEQRQKMHDWQERMERCREAMCRAYDEQHEAAVRHGDDVVVTLYACVNGRSYSIEGIVFGVDETGVQGYKPQSRQGFWLNWDGFDLAKY